jgi:hypothetical protein
MTIVHCLIFYRADCKAQDYEMNGSRDEETNYDTLLSNIIQHVTHSTCVLQQRKQPSKNTPPPPPNIDLLLISCTMYSCLVSASQVMDCRVVCQRCSTISVSTAFVIFSANKVEGRYEPVHKSPLPLTNNISTLLHSEGELQDFNISCRIKVVHY